MSVTENGQFDRDVVEGYRSELSKLEWSGVGTAAMLVETPSPHQHVERDSVQVIAGKGFAGDHDRKSYYRGNLMPGREVSAITLEVLELMRVDPVVVGDNLITRGIDLAALKAGDLVEVGEVLLERSDRPHRPCATFRDRTSPEAFAVAAKDGYRGALFVVRKGGTMRKGDAIRILQPTEAASGDR